MTQDERRQYLLSALLKEIPAYHDLHIPKGTSEQKLLLRALFNIRMPLPADDALIAVQDDYLREETRRKGITDIDALLPTEPGLYLWQGDITTLRCDAIVNAANSALLGCFCPNHGCIDNAIHTFAGIKLRLACAELMDRQGHEEPVGLAKLTPAFNLPCKYVIHTVGPSVSDHLTQKHCELLASCYRSCLSLAEKTGAESIAFPCISTGEFRFPPKIASEIAIGTVKTYLSEKNSQMKVIFDVWKNEDLALYRKLLGTAQTPEA